MPFRRLQKFLNQDSRFKFVSTCEFRTSRTCSAMTESGVCDATIGPARLLNSSGSHLHPHQKARAGDFCRKPHAVRWCASCHTVSTLSATLGFTVTLQKGCPLHVWTAFATLTALGASKGPKKRELPKIATDMHATPVALSVIPADMAAGCQCIQEYPPARCVRCTGRGVAGCFQAKAA